MDIWWMEMIFVMNDIEFEWDWLLIEMDGMDLKWPTIRAYINQT